MDGCMDGHSLELLDGRFTGWAETSVRKHYGLKLCQISSWIDGHAIVRLDKDWGELPKMYLAGCFRADWVSEHWVGL